MTRADSDAYMSLTRHLLELRARLLLSLAGILVGAIGAWFLYTPATTWLTRPLASAGASGINFRTIIGPFSTHITFALWAGFILTTPWWLTQLWLHRPRPHTYGKTTHRTDCDPQRNSFPCGSRLGAVVPPPRGQPFTL